MSIFSEQIASGSAFLSAVVIMAFGAFVINKIKDICTNCKHKNSAMIVRK